MGPLGFALGIHAALQATAAIAPTSWMSFYLDDGHLLGSMTDLAAVFPVLQEQLAAVGLRVNLRKCNVWGPGVGLVNQLVDSHPLREVNQIPFQQDSGLQVLGLPVDFPGTLGMTVGMLEDARSNLQLGLTALLAVPDPQVQHGLLRSCADACKLMFLAQGCDCGTPSVRAAMERADNDIMAAFEDVVGMPLAPIHRL